MGIAAICGGVAWSRHTHPIEDKDEEEAATHVVPHNAEPPITDSLRIDMIRLELVSAFSVLPVVKTHN